MRPLVWFLFLLVLLVGCESKKDQDQVGEKPAPPLEKALAPEAVTTRTLLREPVEAHLLETPAGALPVWRRYGRVRPILVLLSNDPFLQPVPAQVRQKALEVLRREPDETLRATTAIDAVDPLLLPQMALSAALQSGFFSRVIWVLPTKAASEELSVDAFREQLQNFGAVDEKEAKTIEATEGGFTARVRGVPFFACHPSALPALDEPVLLHLDLSFFAPLYRGEIKTPLFPLVYGTLNALRQKNWPVADAAISLSNLSGGLPLETRFLGPILAELFRSPQLLDEPLPENWDRHARALYLQNFFRTDMVRDLYLAMETAAPGDAAVKFGLYQIHRQMKEGTKALAYLDQAVALDRGYALEYLNLAPVAVEKGNPQAELQMLEKAAGAMPGNSFVRLRLAQAYLKRNQTGAAEKLIRELRKKSWSPVYYPDIPDLLEQLETAAASGGGKSG